MRCGLRGVKLVFSDAREGLKAAAAKVLHATWQRCRIHVLRNLLAHVGPSQRAMVAAAIRTVFTQENQEAARRQWRQVADGLRERFDRLAKAMDSAEDDVLAYMTFHPDHWAKISSTNPLERLLGEIKRRTDVVGIFPNEAAIIRLAGALLLEQNDVYGPPSRCKGLSGLLARHRHLQSCIRPRSAAARPQALMVFADRPPDKWTSSEARIVLGLESIPV
jgi:transposase-like protein